MGLKFRSFGPRGGCREVGHMSLRRAPISFLILVGSVVVVTGAAAFACTNLATLNLSSATGKPGDVVTVSGSSFRMPANVTTGIQIRWNGADGPVLAEVRPDKAGNFVTTVTIPDGAPGYYVMTAVLRDAKGADVSGTPARAQFQIVGAPGRPVPPPAAAQSPATATSSGSSGVPAALVLGLGVLGLALFSAGFVAVARTRRPVREAAPVRRG